MNLELRRIAFTDLSHTVPKCDTSTSFLVQNAAASEMEAKILKSIAEDDKASLLSISKLFSPMERKTASKLLHLCCTFDSIDCATALFSGELGVVPLVNEVDDEAKVSSIHTAASAHATRCLELLVRKHARTDLRSRDGRALLPLEMALSRIRMHVTWDPDENSIEDLVVQLTDKDLTAVKILSGRTKEMDEVVYAIAIRGDIIELAALLSAAAEKVRELVLELQNADLEIKERTTIYEFVIREALALGGQGLAQPRAVKKHCIPTHKESAEKRKLLLCEIELLQLFGVVSQSVASNGKKAPSPLILASQAGDEAIVELLLKTNPDINEVDAEGNSALHWCLKTLRGSCSRRIKIMWLLLDHGARVNHKNKLGMSPIHIAAANGNLQALEVLLLEDPECVNLKSEMKETPLFFAVKNDNRACVELLLRWGASTEVLNLRKQRPIDLAASQDMRFMLNTINISPSVSSINRVFPVPQKHTTVQVVEVISETCKELRTSPNKGNNADSKPFPATKAEICKYFESPGGCIRGSKCFYVHAEEGLHPIKRKMDTVHSPIVDHSRKIFVGGLPLSLDSDSLHKFFEEQFGPVEEAVVVGVETGSKLQSRGFGFITFKHKKSVLAAVEAHFVMIMGKQVEIKDALPKWLLPAELQKSCQACDQPHSPGELTPENDIPKVEVTEEGKPALRSWIKTLMHGKKKSTSSECQAQDTTTPLWFKIFKKWLPQFLKHISTRDTEYALSSLKADFRASCGHELDHASVGFTKLSDFMRSFPELCHLKYLPIGQQRPANHMVLLPSLRRHEQKQTKPLPIRSLSFVSTTTGENEDATNCSNDIPVVSPTTGELASTSFSSPFEITSENTKYTSPIAPSRFLQFLTPDPIFHARPWLHNNFEEGKEEQTDQGGFAKCSHKEHLILETLAKGRKNTSMFFLREFDFYNDYSTSIKRGKCFGCKQNQALWANLPCMHLLWCAVCKVQAGRAAGNKEHKCVICDSIVQKVTWFHGMMLPAH